MDDRTPTRRDLLAACGLARGAPAASYDRILQLARRVLGVATAAVSVAEGEQAWLAAQAGAPLPHVPDLIAHLAEADAPVRVPDAHDGAPWAQHRAEAGAVAAVRFVASAPVVLPRGERLGALLVADPAPRTLDAADAETLVEMAALLAERADRERRLRRRSPGTEPEAAGPPTAARALVASIGESISEGIFRSVPGRGLVYVNPACVRMFGYDTADELLRQPPSALYVDPTQRAHVVDDLDREGQFESREERFQRKDGSTFWGLLSGRVTYDAAGRVRHRDGAIVDITQRKQMEQRLRESEQRWQRLVENHPDAVFISDGGRLRYANPAGARLFGVDAPDVLIGRSVFAFVPDAVQPRIRQRQLALDRGAPTAPIEHAIVRPDGTERTIEVNSVPIEHDGQMLVQTVARDVTARRRAEQRLRAAEAKFRGLVEQSLVGIYIIQAGRFAYANPALAEILGHAAEALMADLRVQDVVLDDDWPLVRDNLQRRLDGTVDEVKYAFRIQRPDGAVRHVEVHGARTEHDGAPAVIGTLLDITERTEWERTLIAAKEEAEEMNRLKSAFLANMSHEIRTPLTAIIGFADLIGSSPESAGEFAVLIQRSGQRLLRTLNSVLDLAQLEADALELHPERVELVEEVRQTMAPFRLQAQQKEIDLRVSAPGPIEGRLDRTAFQRIVTNLVSNAIKFTHAGHVTVALRTAGRHVELRVIDTGIGVDAAFQQQIFDEFRQASSGQARTHEGSGLGLTITHRLVALMGGTIALDSTPGEGSTFTVVLPRAAE